MGPNIAYYDLNIGIVDANQQKHSPKLVCQALFLMAMGKLALTALNTKISVVIRDGLCVCLKEISRRDRTSYLQSAEPKMIVLGGVPLLAAILYPAAAAQ